MDTKVFGYLKWDDSSMIKVDPMDAGQQKKKPTSVPVTRCESATQIMTRAL